MEAIVQTVVRLHGPVTLRLVDQVALGCGLGYLAAGALLALVGQSLAAGVATLGGTAFLAGGSASRRRYVATMWDLAAAEPDPVRALAIYEYLYRLPFSDLDQVARWRAERDRLGLPIEYDDPEAPAPVHAVWRHLADFPRER